MHVDTGSFIEAVLEPLRASPLTLPKDKMAASEVVDSYKKLGLVEEAFRSLKTVQLEVRPVYHKTDDRIRSHVFVCTLAYYLQWHSSNDQRILVPIVDTREIGSNKTD